MYATKRRRRTVKSVKTPAKEPPKSNPSKRHRERLNGELDHLASLLPFEQSVISKLDKLSILRLAVSYLRTKSFFQSVLPSRYGIESHLMNRSHLFLEPGFSEGESILQALYGFLFVVTCEGEVFFASRTVEQYLGFHQSDIIHQSVMELIHSEDREEFKRQLTWNALLPGDKASISLHEMMLPDNAAHLHRSFTVRFRCLLDNTSGFITLEINGWIRILHGQGPHADEPQLALFATCSPFGPLSLFDIPSREMTFKTKHKMDFSPVTMDSRGKTLFAYRDQELATRSGYDLVHPDDLNYFACAHQELIKTGSSGLISYRWQTKLHQWIWMQSSCKVIYKNSKPDFIICTHRQLTEDEGQDLFGKRGNEFKLPYPLLDIDMCAGFGFGDDEISSKPKSSKSKKKAASSNGTSASNSSSVSNAQLNSIPSANGVPMYDGSLGSGVTPGVGKDFQGGTGGGGGGGGSGKKRKSSAMTSSTASCAAAAATAATATCIIGGLPPYCAYPTGFVPYDSGGAAMMGAGGDPLKVSESLYSYNPGSFGFDATDMYRAQGPYGALHAATSLYHHPQSHHQAAAQEPYRLDVVEKHQSYFLDAHSRQYPHQHHHLSPALPPTPYGNTVSGYGSGVNCSGSEFSASAGSKYPYDVSSVPCAYGFDSYSIDFSKRMECGDLSQIPQIPSMHPDMKRSYPFDYTAHTHSPHASSYHSHSGLIDPHSIHERYTTPNRLGIQPVDPVDLRNTSGLFNTNSFMNTVDISGANTDATSSPSFNTVNNNPTPSTSNNHPNTSPSSSSLFKPIVVSASSPLISTASTTTKTTHQSNTDAKDLSSIDPSSNLSPLVLPIASYDTNSTPFSLPHNSVIKSTRQRNASHAQAPPPSSNANCDMSMTHARPSPGKSPWRYGSKPESSHEVSPMASMAQLDGEKVGDHPFSTSSETNLSLNSINSVRCQEKDSSITGIPVSVVKQPAWSQGSINPNTTTANNNNNNNNSSNINNNNNNTNSNSSSERLYSSNDNNGVTRDRLRVTCSSQGDVASDGNVDNINRDITNNNNNNNNNRNNNSIHYNSHDSGNVYDSGALYNNNNSSMNNIVYPSVNCPVSGHLPDKDWISTQTDLYSKSSRVLFSDPCHSVKHFGLKVYERGDNPLLSFSEMTHSLMSSSY